MKKLTTLAIAISLLVAMNCSKSNDPVPAPAPDPLLVGTWRLVYTSRTGCTDASQNRPAMYCHNRCLSRTFTATTWTVTYPNSAWSVTPPTTGTYTITGNNITFIYSDGTTSTYQYTVTSTNFTFTDNPSFDNCINGQNHIRE